MDSNIAIINLCLSSSDGGCLWYMMLPRSRANKGEKVDTLNASMWSTPTSLVKRLCFSERQCPVSYVGIIIASISQDYND